MKPVHGHQGPAAPIAGGLVPAGWWGHRWAVPAGVGAGGVILVACALLDPAFFWPAYLFAFHFWLQIAQGCLGLLLLHYLVGGRWSRPGLPILEAGAMLMPWMALLFLPLFLGLPALYAWTDDARMATVPVLQAKQGYLNVPFFALRALLYLAVWSLLAYLAVRSRQRGRSAADMKPLAVVGLILFMLTATFAAYDWLMSLEPTWFSSIFGLLVIAGQAVAGMGLTILGLALFYGRRTMAEGEADGLNDLGNLLLGFVLIWAYFAFSQYLIIWSANISEEAAWYVHRSRNGWQVVAGLLVAVHLVLPFVLLLSRRIKRNPRALLAIVLILFAARAVELAWFIWPAFSPHALHLSWPMGLGCLVALGSGWIPLFLRRWAAHSA